MNLKLKRRDAAALIGLAALGVRTAKAQAFPSRPITFVVPYPPGASTDLVARLVGQHVSQSAGQTVVVENRGGANGTIGATQVARSPADGYRLLFATTPMLAINPFLYKDLPIDVNKDLTPVSHVANALTGIAVHPSLGVDSLPELIALAKKQPEGLLYGSSGAGSAQHIAGLMIGTHTGTRWTHVPYRGSGPMVADLVAGNVKVGIGTVAGFAPHLKDGRLKLIAIGEKTRFPLLPDVPTISETVPNVAFTAWLGFFAPTGTPRDVVDYLSTHINRALKLPDVRDKLAQAYIQVVAEGPDVLARQVKADQATYSRIIREEKISLQ
jgi:tripartite-type tricarboxylate transporter receptor subunit TctC